MKNSFFNFVVISLALVSLLFCQKPEGNLVAAEPVVLTFTSEKPVFEDETKTEWTGNGIRWSEGDRISVAYTVDGAWQNVTGDAHGDAKLYKSLAIDRAADVAHFTVSAAFDGTNTGSHVFYGVYPAPEATGFSGAPSAVLTVPAIQCPESDSYDARGDLMVAKSDEYVAFPSAGEAVGLRWSRLVAHAYITLKNINGFTSGEKISEIILTAQSGANLVGQQKVNLITGGVTCDNQTSNVLKIAGRNLTVDASGNLTFWACMLPAKVTSLKVELVTDKATYTRNISSCNLDFKKNARNILGIKMHAASRQERKSESWHLVTPSAGLSDGTYALLVKTQTQTGTLVSTNGTGAAPTFYTTNISIDGDELHGVTETMQFDLYGSTGEYKLAVAGQTVNHLYSTNNNNGIRIGSSNSNTWMITRHPDNASAFVMKNASTGRYLGVYNNQDWRCYTTYNAQNFAAATGSSEVYMYKKIVTSGSGNTVPQPAISVAQTLSLPYYETSGTLAVSFVNTASVETNAYADAACTVDCTWMDVKVDGETITYEAAVNNGAERNAYILIRAFGVDAASVVQVVKVTQSAKAEGPSGPVRPAVDENWLELPGAVNGSSYVVNTYYDGSKRNYTHLYDKGTYTSLWTAYPLNSSHMGSLSRPGSWYFSPLIDEGVQVDLTGHSYNDNYSRGHLIPNASRNGNSVMQKQTFYVTNSVPQIQNSFNGGIWQSLEGTLQTIGGSEEIYIVTGVLFNKVGENKSVTYTTAKDDTKDVPVPNYFYKVVLKTDRSGNTVTDASTVGFWFEHKTYSNDSYVNYVVSVDQIEQWTGFDFFVNLPDSIEETAERNANWSTFQSF